MPLPIHLTLASPCSIDPNYHIFIACSKTYRTLPRSNLCDPLGQSCLHCTSAFLSISSHSTNPRPLTVVACPAICLDQFLKEKGRNVVEDQNIEHRITTPHRKWVLMTK